MSTIDVENVVALLGRDLTDAEMNRVGTLLDLAEGVVEDQLPGYSVATGEAEDAVLDSWWLPRYPVTAVDELSINGSAVESTRFTFTEDGELQWLYTPLVDVFEVNLTWPAFINVTASYSFGLDPPNGSVVHEIATAVATTLRRQATNPDGIMSESLGAYSVSYGTAEQAALAAGLFVNVANLQRVKRQVTSVALVG